MIMQARTPRALSRTGAVLVLAVGLLLPLAPIQAQQQVDDKPNSSKPPVSPSAQKIEALERAERWLGVLQDVELVLDPEQKEEHNLTWTQKTNSDDSALGKAARELAEVSAQIDAKRKDLQQLEARQRALKARMDAILAKQNKSEKLKEASIELQWRSVSPELKYNVELPVEFKTTKPEWHIELRRPNQPDELEKKLDRLSKEIDELRRELRGKKAGENKGH